MRHQSKGTQHVNQHNKMQKKGDTEIGGGNNKIFGTKTKPVAKLYNTIHSPKDNAKKRNKKPSNPRKSRNFHRHSPAQYKHQIFSKISHRKNEYMHIFIPNQCGNKVITYPIRKHQQICTKTHTKLCATTAVFRSRCFRKRSRNMMRLNNRKHAPRVRPDRSTILLVRQVYYKQHKLSRTM